jgi:hypothetical protein
MGEPGEEKESGRLMGVDTPTVSEKSVNAVSTTAIKATIEYTTKGRSGNQIACKELMCTVKRTCLEQVNHHNRYLGALYRL